MDKNFENKTDLLPWEYSPVQHLRSVPGDFFFSSLAKAFAKEKFKSVFLYQRNKQKPAFIKAGGTEKNNWTYSYTIIWADKVICLING